MQQIKFTNSDGTDEGCRFTEHLVNTIINRRLVPGINSAMDWLKLLTENELKALSLLLEQTFIAPDNLSPDLPQLLLHLHFLETGQKAAIRLDSLIDCLTYLRVMCDFAFFVKQGYMEIFGNWRITEPEVDNQSAVLTDKGYKAASELGAPALLRQLRQQAGRSDWN
jgi:hypothetical protein